MNVERLTMPGIKCLLGATTIIVLRESLNWFSKFTNMGNADGPQMVTILVGSYFIGSAVLFVGNAVVKKN